MTRYLLLVLLAWCAATPVSAAVFDATSADFSPSYLSTSANADSAAWRAWNDQAASAPVVGTYLHQANVLVYSGSSQGIGIQAAGVARDNPAYAVLGTSLDMILARATDDQGIYVVARAPGDLLATPARLVPLNPVVSMSWTADPWGPDFAAHLGQTLTYTVLSLAATAPRSGLPGCLQIRETNSYNNQRRTFYWQVGTPWPVEVQDDRSLDAGTTLTWAATPVTDLIAPADPVGVWIRQGGNLATGEYRIVAFFANGTWGRFQRLAAEGGTSLWQIGTWRVTGPGTIETTVTYRVGNPTFLDAVGSTTSGQSFSQSPTGTLTFNAETFDRSPQTGTDGAYWFGQDPDGYGVIANLDGAESSGDEPVAALAVFSGTSYLYWEDNGTVTAGSEWGTTANVIPASGFDATVVGDENGPSGFANGAMPANFAPGGLMAPSIMPGMGIGSRIAAAEVPIFYDGNGATGGATPTPQSKVQGVTLTLDANSGALARTGFTFAGWNTADDGSGTAYAAGGSYTLDAPVTMYAQWTLITYAVAYDANGGTGSIASDTKSFGIDLALSTGAGFSRTGYTFAGWDTVAGGGGTAYAGGGTYNANAVVTLYAQWTLITYAVAYDANGGSGSIASDTKSFGIDLTLSIGAGFTRTGYTFTGWDTVPGGGGTPYAAGGTYSANAAVTLYAQWTLITYVVTYNANGGTGSIASDTKSFGIDLALSTGAGFTRTGYTFAGWDTVAVGGGTPYAAGGTYATNAAVTLYAQWTLITYAVTYDANGGTGSIASGTKSFGIDLTLSNGAGFTRTGYTFAGWDTVALGGGTPYAAGGAYSANAAVTLYAQWTLITYAVAYDPNGGTGSIAAATKSYSIDLTLSDGTGFTRTGYAFAGWNTVALGGGTPYAASSTYAANAAVTLYAQWTLNTYAVTFDANGATTGTAPASQTKTQGVDLVLTTSTGGLGRAGSLFAGWNTASDGTGAAYQPGATYALDAAVTLYAAWTTVPGGGSPAFGFVDGGTVRQVVAGDRVSIPLRVSPNLGLELLASVIITGPFAGLDAANGNWPSPAGSATTLEQIGGRWYQRLAPAVTDQAMVLTIPSGASGTMTIAFGPEVQGLIASGLTSSVVIRAASTTPMTGAASDYVAGQNLSSFSIQPGDTVTQQALSGTAVSGPQDLNLVAVNGTPPYTMTLLAGSAEIRPWKPFAAAVDWDGDGNADTGQWFTIVPRAAGTITVRISDSAGQSLDRSMSVLTGVVGSAIADVPASSTQESVYTLVGAAGFGGVDALLARFQGAGANPLVRRGFVYGPRSKAWFELPTLPSEGTPMPWDGFYLADRTGDDLSLTVEALGVPPYIPLYPGWNVLALPPLRQGGGSVLPAISATDFDLYDEFGNTIARSAFDDVMGRPQTWNGTTFVELTSIAVGQGFFLKNNLSGANPRMLYVVPGRQALSSGVRTKANTLRLHARSTAVHADIIPATGVMGRPPAPPAAVNASSPSTTGGGCGAGGGMGLMVLGSLALLVGRQMRRNG